MQIYNSENISCCNYRVNFKITNHKEKKSKKEDEWRWIFKIPIFLENIRDPLLDSIPHLYFRNIFSIQNQ